MKEIPLGFMFSIANNNEAMKFYSNLSQNQKDNIFS